MPQFTNPYNAQNGMMPSQNPMAPPMGNMYGQSPQNVSMMPLQNVQTQQPIMTTAQNQNWKVYSPGPQMPPLVGRWVNNFDEIKPQDVPMDGSVCFFPQADQSCIYAMTWSNNGTIVPYRFLPEKNESPVAQTTSLSSEMNDILKGYENISYTVADRLDAIDKRIDELLNSLQSSKPTRTSKSVDKEEK